MTAKKFSFGNCKPGTAFTIIEVIVSLGVLFILLSWLLPAVSGAREAARRSNCQNNLRNVAFGVMMENDARNRLSENRYHWDPSRSFSVADENWFSRSFPFIANVASVPSFEEPELGFWEMNRNMIGRSLSLFRCPSSPLHEEIVGVVRYFNGPPERSTPTMLGDYCGNFGTNTRTSTDADEGYRRLGPFSNRFDGTPSQSLSSFRSGRSNTAFMWESSSSFYYQRSADGSLFQTPWKVQAERQLADTFIVERVTGRGVSFANPETVISYMHSLPGGRIGSAMYFNVQNSVLWEVDVWRNVSSQTINISNGFGQPFAFHPGTANVAFADGAIRSMSDRIEARVFMSLVTLVGDRLVSDFD